MKRREFVGLLAAVPLLGLGQQPTKGVTDYLTKAYNAACKGRSGIHIPNQIRCSHEFYKQFSREMLQSCKILKVDPNSPPETNMMIFKSAIISPSRMLTGKNLSFHSEFFI